MQFKKCIICGKEMVRKASESYSYFSKKKFCSTSCMGLFNSSRKASPEIRLKMSLSRKGKKLSKDHADKISKGKKGKKFSDDHKKHLSESRSGKNTGENHPNWKGGISKDKKWVSWRKNKRNRTKRILNNQGLGHTFGEWNLLKIQYNYTCPCCKKQEPEISLTEDHVIPLSKGGSDLIENIQPLCLHCNMVKHTNIIKY